MTKTKKLIIFGGGETADLAFHYFTDDSEYKVFAFTINKEYIESETKHEKPVVDFDIVETLYSPDEYEMFVAASSTNLNTIRTKMYRMAKGKGYILASYISSHAYVGAEVEFGDNCFIMEDNTIQSFVKIGNNVVLWSGNHIGHSGILHDNCFITSHVVLSGFCEVGSYTFIGVNSCVANNVKIGEKCLIAIGSIIVKDVKDNSIMKMAYAKQYPIPATKFYKVDDFNF